MMEVDDAFLDAFEDDMARLSRRPYPEIGVPMYLVPEDLSGGRPDPAPDPEGGALAEEFAAIVAALERRNGSLTSSDIARVIEVLADRTFLDVPFSSLSDDRRT